MDVAPATLLARLLAKGRLRHLQLLAGVASSAACNRPPRRSA